MVSPRDQIIGKSHPDVGMASVVHPVPAIDFLREKRGVFIGLIENYSVARPINQVRRACHGYSVVSVEPGAEGCVHHVELAVKFHYSRIFYTPLLLGALSLECRLVLPCEIHSVEAHSMPHGRNVRSVPIVAGQVASAVYKVKNTVFCDSRAVKYRRPLPTVLRHWP